MMMTIIRKPASSVSAADVVWRRSLSCMDPFWTTTVKLLVLGRDGLHLRRFTASWQQKQFSAISKHPPKDAVVQVLDFAENYTCQYQREIQSVHWHHTTVTLHLIVCYYQCADWEEGGVVCETLAFISDDKVHDFHAVQTFVCLAMEHLRGRRQLDVQRVIQWTDGCERSPSVRCAASHPVDGWMCVPV